MFAGRGAAVVALLGLGLAAQAHFVVLEPESDILEDIAKPMEIKALFTHPTAHGPAMEMAKPVQFGVMVDGAKQDLLGALRRFELDGKSAYELKHQFKRPGDYVFYCEPAKYWEPAENKYIVHYTKVVVDVLGAEEGWDAMVGFPVEIEPLTRPYGLWTGNCFTGIVKRDGKPVPFAAVEVERLSEKAGAKLPADVFTTQVVKADANGVFTYAIPKAGWWGFAALVDGAPVQRDGKEVGMELGGLIWVKAVDMD